MIKSNTRQEILRALEKYYPNATHAEIAVLAYKAARNHVSIKDTNYQIGAKP